LLTAG
jgi:hypothetical protein